MRIETVRAGLACRLRERHAEIEQAVLTRARAISDPRETADPEYMQGLWAAVAAAIEYGIESLERSEDRFPPIPTALLTQARLAARNRISLETVLRRYFAGYTVLEDFVIEESERSPMPMRGAALKGLLRGQATLFDRVVTAVTEEYGREERGRVDTTERRRSERVERLLAGELADTSELLYEFGGWHLGGIAVGLAAAEEMRGLLAGFDCQALVIGRGEETAWFWLGSRSAIDPGGQFPAAKRGKRVTLALGEPASGLDGWRLTHRQAAAALPVAMRGEETYVRYGDVALIASILQDDLLVDSLRRRYLLPLTGERDGGETLRRTLCAYFSAAGNIASAAAALGVSRPTVTSRLAKVEEYLDRPVSGVGPEIEVALRLHDLEDLSAH